jgi:hypothetical protein
VVVCVCVCGGGGGERGGRGGGWGVGEFLLGWKKDECLFCFLLCPSSSFVFR